MTFPEHWKAALRNIPLFSDLETALENKPDLFVEKEIKAGECLMREGDEANSVYITLDGKLEVVLERDETILLEYLGPARFVGEIALIVGGKRTATVRAVETTHVLEVTRQKVGPLLDEHPEIMRRFSGYLSGRLKRVKTADLLNDMFTELNPEALQEIANEMTWKHFDSGQEVIRRGEQSEGAYIVALGRLGVMIEDNRGKMRLVDEVGRGEWIGEMSLLTNTPNVATIFALRSTELLHLSQASFERIIKRFPEVLLAMTRRLAARMHRHVNRQARPHMAMKTLAVIPARNDVVVQDFTRQLVKALEGYGSVLHLTAKFVDDELGKEGIASVSEDEPAYFRLAPWLLELEYSHDFIVYEAEQTWSEWTERAIRHADRILIVADGAGSSNLAENDKRLAEAFKGVYTPPKSLVLIQPPKSKTYPGTSKWLEPRGVDSHFHVRKGSTWDVGRVARMLTGNAVCLVLGGGGSRGYAHIGVMRAFEQLKIPIDAVGGTSIGSVIAAAAAVELSSEEILKQCAPILGEFLDPTLPVVSLMSGNRAVQGVLDVAGPSDIEDLPIPFFCVSTNLTRSEQVIHRRGSLVVAARASGSVPGIFPPVPVNGDLLVDGGLCNNVPVDVMHSLFGGVIIAVDVIPEVDLTTAADAPPSLSGWDVAWRALNPFAKRVAMPNIVNILMRSATAASVAFSKTSEKAKGAALYLRPSVSRWNVLDFKAAAPIADEGYRGTIKEIETFWAANGDRIMGRARSK